MTDKTTGAKRHGIMCVCVVLHGIWLARLRECEKGNTQTRADESISRSSSVRELWVKDAGGPWIATRTISNEWHNATMTPRVLGNDGKRGKG